MVNMVTKTQKTRIYPNLFMRNYIDQACDYRRYCYNLALETWQNMYWCRRIMLPVSIRNSLKKKIHDKNIELSFAEEVMNQNTPAPNEKRVRNEMVANKADWQDLYSARILQLAVKDLSVAWDNFFDPSLPDWGMPKFKAKKDNKQSFRTDRAKIDEDDNLLLDKPLRINKKLWSGIKMAEEPKSTDLKTVSIIKTDDKYYACLTYEYTPEEKAKTGKSTAVDVNVGHFNCPNETLNVLPKRLNRWYKRIKHYQRLLAKKRNVNGKEKAKRSHNYQKTRAKLSHSYQKITNIQHDIVMKFTTWLVNNYDTITIETLNVKAMQMSHVASKELQRSLFGKFKRELTYKCNWYNKELVLADKFYPSTQRCSRCGWVKRGKHKLTLRGNKQDHEDHSTYICQHCGLAIDRDYNACLNLLAYPILLKTEPEYLKRICRTQAMA